MHCRRQWRVACGSIHSFLGRDHLVAYRISKLAAVAVKSKLHRMERYLDDMKKQIEYLKADKDKLIADKDIQLKDLEADK